MKTKEEAFEDHADQYDNFGDTWQDMGVDEHFYAGWDARQKEIDELKEKTQALIDIIENREEIPPLKWAVKCMDIISDTQPLLKSSEEETQ